MLDPLPMIEFLELHACSVRIKGRHALKWGTCSNSNTEQQYSRVSRRTLPGINFRQSKAYVLHKPNEFAPSQLHIKVDDYMGF